MLDLSNNINLFNGDCLEVMDRLIEQGVVVDAIITDPPYGTTACKWDSVIPFDEMWKRLNKIVKPNGAIVLFGSEPFSSALRMSNIKNYKYDWIWDKSSAGNVLVAKYQPLKIHELIHVFSSKGKATYYPQYTFGHKDRTEEKAVTQKSDLNQKIKSGVFVKSKTNKPKDAKYPKSILDFSKQASECANSKSVHPTQKPVALMEYLIKTYTNEYETVLDFTCGSGSTGVAAVNTNRKFIGIELDETYFNISKERIENA
ncbi:DNA methylase [Edwardsiella phage vB_EtaM_ET-ABTNL-9]|nr:DNA methylase [Edwardsiella phage vB_EtaM_ET-ABTNL-9]